MYSSYSIFIFILSVANLTAAHGIITKPYPRTVGNASLTACGSAITDIIKADNTSHVEGLPEAGASDPGYNATECNLWLCKGLQFEDNINNGREYLYTERVDISVFIRIPHKGIANVSVVDTTTNEIIGTPLITWHDYADGAVATLPANNTQFSISFPAGLGQCGAPGLCVIQWWWYGTEVDQTYESCIDFHICTPCRDRGEAYIMVH